jgi:DNA-binding CsgD family transcriptional regulator
MLEGGRDMERVSEIGRDTGEITDVAAGGASRSPLEPSEGRRRGRRTRSVALSRAALSEAEQKVLRLLANGLSARASAVRLDVSEAAIQTHRARIMDKLGIRTLAGLTRYAVHTRVVSLGSWWRPDSRDAPAAPGVDGEAARLGGRN